jgi:hypothetical protein
MLYGIKIPFKTIAQQTAGIRQRYPHFVVSVSRNGLRASGPMRPTARSISYVVEICYSEKVRPDIRVISPALETNGKAAMIPHTYSENKLCLYHPLYGDFQYDDLLSETILPWIPLWLYHYENWHMTGNWLGGGTHPVQNDLI